MNNFYVLRMSITVNAALLIGGCNTYFAGVSEQSNETTTVTRVQHRANYLADLASVHLNYSDFDEAINLLLQAIAVTKDVSENALHHYSLAKAYQGKGMSQEALRHFQRTTEIYKRLIKQAPQSRWVYAQRICSIYKEIGAHQEAEQWLEQEMGNVEKSLKNLLAIAELYALIGDRARTLKYLEEAANLAKTEEEKVQILAVKASFYTMVGQLEKAEQEYKALLSSKDPKIASAAKRALIDLYIRQGKTDKLDFVERENK